MRNVPCPFRIVAASHSSRGSLSPRKIPIKKGTFSDGAQRCLNRGGPVLKACRGRVRLTLLVANSTPPRQQLIQRLNDPLSRIPSEPTRTPS